MINRALASLSLSALMLGGSVVGCAGGGDHVATLADSAPRVAGTDADRAGKALARGHADEAIRFAERAVSASPRQADYRVLLGQSYLKAGRFTSARDAFADVLRLDPANGKAALDMALAQIGLGDWAGARTTLDGNAATVPAADRGLAMALAGDPVGAVRVLTAAARSSGSDVKTRQNLALALALAGHWPESRAVAAADLSPADVDRRMTQWASFARPSGAADQVSALLGVVPVVDAGQPVALALVAPAPMRAEPVAVAAAQVESPSAPEPAGPAPVPEVATIEPPVVAPPVAERAVVRQPVAVAHPIDRATVRSPAVRSTPGAGWFVQIGAFRDAAGARDGWMRAIRRDAAFRVRLPEGAAFRARTGQVYRLSIGGFSRAQADAACHGYRARGGACFVRAGAGDQIARWARKTVELAAR